MSIKNYALIEDIHVNFGDGLTIITGETGAGKSILIEGLSLILGQRADLTAIKDITKKCIIEGVFKIANYNLEPFFLEEDLDYEDETIIRREILPSGKSRAFINDSPVNLSILSALGEKLIDVHSQHQNTILADDKFQFQVIDALANNDQHLSKYKSTLLSFNTLKKELERLHAEKADAIREQDYNAFLYNELSEIKLIPGEYEALELEQKSLSNFESIREGLNASFELLNNEDIGIIKSLSTLRNTLKNLAEYSAEYDKLYDRVNSAMLEVEDIYSDIERTKDNLEADPGRLETINEQLSVTHNLLLKHAVKSVDELIGIRDELSRKVDAFEHIDEEIERKQTIFQIKENELNALAAKIHDERKHAIPTLIDQLQIILTDLGMEHAKFDLQLTFDDKFFSNGKDSLNFLFTANKGTSLKPLKQAASGGELSRIMLAIKAVLSNYMHLPTIMFDEIDTGVSGEISNKIANIMKQMSETMQVFTITHLPQIAAKGDTHFKVFKEDKNNIAITQLNKLNQKERVMEIAQMLSGTDMTNSAIAHAKELLN